MTSSLRVSGEADNESKDSRYSLVNFLPSDSEVEEDGDEELVEAAFESLSLPEPQAKQTRPNSPKSPCTHSPKSVSGMSLSSRVLAELNQNVAASSSSSGDGRSKPTKRRSSFSNEMSISPNRVALSVIQDFVETTIVLRKDNEELGISIVGGSDTYLEVVCVTEVHTDGAAYKDGRIRKGDVILAVNDISFRDVPQSDSVRVLKEASSPLKLMILRENPQTLFTTSQNPTKFITVEMRKTSIKDKLGLSFVQRTNGRGVFITFVQPNSLASRHGKQIMQGDQILEVNGVSVRDYNQKDAAQLINSLDGAIVLLLGRVASLSTSIQEWARKKSQNHWRTRTSTWSSYTANNKEKVQNQRPSLPISKDTAFFAAESPDKEIEPGSPFAIFSGLTQTGFETDEGMISRSSSIRSRIRLSIVVEDTSKARTDSTESEDGLEVRPDGANPLLPSIQVTEF